MPEKLDRCVSRLLAQGKSKESAYAICTASIQRRERKRKKQHRAR